MKKVYELTCKKRTKDEEVEVTYLISIGNKPEDFSFKTNKKHPDLLNVQVERVNGYYEYKVDAAQLKSLLDEEYQEEEVFEITHSDRNSTTKAKRDISVKDLKATIIPDWTANENANLIKSRRRFIAGAVILALVAVAAIALIALSILSFGAPAVAAGIIGVGAVTLASTAGVATAATVNTAAVIIAGTSIFGTIELSKLSILTKQKIEKNVENNVEKNPGNNEALNELGGEQADKIEVGIKPEDEGFKNIIAPLESNTLEVTPKTPDKTGEVTRETPTGGAQTSS